MGSFFTGSMWVPSNHKALGICGVAWRCRMVRDLGIKGWRVPSFGA